MAMPSGLTRCYIQCEQCKHGEMSWSLWLTARMLLLLLWLRRPLKERVTRGIEIRILGLAFALFVTALALLLGFGRLLVVAFGLALTLR
jgi:hypothetical protein